MRKARHFDSIDLLRGLAALAVCLFHLSTHFLAETNPLRWVGRHGHLGVECFFVISGFIIPYTLWRKDYRLRHFPRFMAARLLRLHPAYLGSLVLVLLTLWVPNFLPPPWHQSSNIDWTNAVLHIGFLSEIAGRPWLNGVYWSLAIEMQYYILLGLAYPLLAHRRSWLGCLFGVAFAASALLSPGFLVGRYAGLFLPGILLFAWHAGRMRTGWLLGCLALDAALLRWLDGGFWGVGAVATACAAIVWLRGSHPFTTLLGRVSYSFYLLHTIVAFAFLDLLTPRFTDELTRTLLVLAATALAIAVATLYHRWVEQPTQRLGQRWFRAQEKPKTNRRMVTFPHETPAPSLGEVADMLPCED